MEYGPDGKLGADHLLLGARYLTDLWRKAGVSRVRVEG
jgi:hypothetical protein